MNAMDVYLGSDGKATTALYAELEQRGPLGIVAVNLFRAQKCSSRAKSYRRGGFRRDAYDRKNWSIAKLSNALLKCGLGWRWGWKEDAAQQIYPWVLYVELPTGQVSFHAAARGVGPDYPGEWDRQPLSAERVIRFVDSLLQGGALTHTAKPAKPVSALLNPLAESEPT
jgi:hypothetical protein